MSLFYTPKRATPKQPKYSILKYFSDLFIMLMVISWIVVDAIMVIMAIYATMALQDTSIWGYVESLTAVPLTAGGAIWMVKNAVQHAILNSKGRECPSDFHPENCDCGDEAHHVSPESFAKVDGVEEVIEQETIMGFFNNETEAEG